MPVSSAHVIEAVRLAEALASRARPAGAGARGIQRRGDVGAGRRQCDAICSSSSVAGISAIGSAACPKIFRPPRCSRISRRCRSACACRRRPRIEDLDLDLREPLDRERSQLLRRLRLLGVDVGHAGSAGERPRHVSRIVAGARGNPEFAITLIEASRYGHTVEQAAATCVDRERSAERHATLRS